MNLGASLSHQSVMLCFLFLYSVGLDLNVQEGCPCQ